MTTSYFDSLVHATSDGSWLGSRRYDAGIARLHAELDAVPGSRACLVAIAGYADNDTVLRCWRAAPERFVPVGSINPAQYDSEEAVAIAVRDLKTHGFQGVKLHPRLGGYDPLDARCLAAVKTACDIGLVVFLDTLFRQPGVATRHPSDVIDTIARLSTAGRVVLLHGGGPAMLEVFELVRMHAHLVLDLSFSLLRYAGSSLDADMHFIMWQLDQRVSIGSDMPEYTPRQALERLQHIAGDLPIEKRENILWRNLDRLFPREAHHAPQVITHE